MNELKRPTIIEFQEILEILKPILKINRSVYQLIMVAMDMYWKGTLSKDIIRKIARDVHVMVEYEQRIGNRDVKARIFHRKNT